MATTIMAFDESNIGNTQVYNLWVEDVGDYSIMCGRYLKAHMKELRSMVERGYIRNKKVRIA